MTLKEKIQNKQKTSGTLLNLNDVASGLILGRCGYDFIWVDMEHSCLSLENLLGQISALKNGGTAVVVRVPQNDLTFTKKVLEMGVDGIIFPMLKTVEEVNEMIACTLYPPYGTRGCGPQNAIGYGFDDIGEYIQNTCEHLCRFIQIEHKDLVDNLQEVVKNPYIDGYIFGPSDLSGSIGELGNLFGENNLALIQRAMEVLNRENKYTGLATGDVSEETIARWHAIGVDMLAVGADYDFLRRWAVQNREALDRLHKEAK